MRGCPRRRRAYPARQRRAEANATAILRTMATPSTPRSVRGSRASAGASTGKRRSPEAPATTRAGIEAALGALGGQCICGNLRMAARLVTAFYDAALRPVGIEANQMIMLWVAHESDRMPASELAYAAGIDQSTASRNLAVLEGRGLVTASPAPDDRRQRLVRLTPRGRELLIRAFPHWERAQAELSAFSGDLADLRAVGRVLRKVARRLQDR
jgi:DNA-binding MarR family transcriptional regulator